MSRVNIKIQRLDSGMMTANLYPVCDLESSSPTIQFNAWKCLHPDTFTFVKHTILNRDIFLWSSWYVKLGQDRLYGKSQTHKQAVQAVHVNLQHAVGLLELKTRRGAYQINQAIQSWRNYCWCDGWSWSFYGTCSSTWMPGIYIPMYTVYILYKINGNSSIISNVQVIVIWIWSTVTSLYMFYNPLSIVPVLVCFALLCFMLTYYLTFLFFFIPVLQALLSEFHEAFYMI